jgi:hypothetical protein
VRTYNYWQVILFPFTARSASAGLGAPSENPHIPPFHHGGFHRAISRLYMRASYSLSFEQGTDETQLLQL